MADTSYQGRPCYKVEERPPQSVKISSSIPVVVESIIDKESFFLYSEKHFSSRGSILHEKEFRNVVLNPVLDDALFQIPSDVSIVIANQLENFQKASIKTAQEMFPAPKAVPAYVTRFSLSNWFQQHFDFFISTASYLLFILGAGLLIFITIYKVKERYGSRRF